MLITGQAGGCQKGQENTIRESQFNRKPIVQRSRKAGFLGWIPFPPFLRLNMKADKDEDKEKDNKESGISGIVPAGPLAGMVLLLFAKGFPPGAETPLPL